MSNRRSERRIRNNRIRRQKEIHKNFLLTMITICFVFIFSFGINGFLSNAKDDTSQITYKYYKSITISNGDTLWSIAQAYMDTEHYDSISDYIKEVKQLNVLSNDEITYGSHLIIPYYLDK